LKKLKITLTFFLIILNSCDNRIDEMISQNCIFEMCDEWFLYTKDSTKLFVREFGVGDTIIVIHGGWGAEHSYLIDAFVNFADKYHFLFYDQRGSLRSPCADSLISFVKHIDDIEQIRNELGIKKIKLIGHSMGGFLAMSYFEKYPENVEKLVLIASPSAKSSIYDLTEGISESTLKRWKRQEVMDTLSANGLNKDKKSLRESGLYHRITFAAINLYDIKNWRKVKGCFYYNETSGIMSGLTTPEEWDYCELVEKTNIPITFIYGDDDYITLSRNEEWMLPLCNVELKIIKNAGHLCWIDQPEIFKTYILSALENIKKD